jgi:hypothetical protein
VEIVKRLRPSVGAALTASLAILALGFWFYDSPPHRSYEVAIATPHADLTAVVNRAIELDNPNETEKISKSEQRPEPSAEISRKVNIGGDLSADASYAIESNVLPKNIGGNRNADEDAYSDNYTDPVNIGKDMTVNDTNEPSYSYRADGPVNIGSDLDIDSYQYRAHDLDHTKGNLGSDLDVEDM